MEKSDRAQQLGARGGHTCKLPSSSHHRTVMQSVSYGCWGNELKYDKQPYNFLHRYQKHETRDNYITVLMGQNAFALLVCCLQLQLLFRSVHIFL